MSVFALALSVLLGVQLSADAHSNHLWHDWYLYNSSSCTQVLDPVNLEFSVWGIPTNTETHITGAGWSNTSGSTQYFKDHGTCTSMDFSGATASDGTSGRQHVRTEYHNYSTPVGWVSFGAAHDDYRHGLCQFNHPHSYNGPRNALNNAIATSFGHSHNWQTLWNGAQVTRTDCSEIVTNDGYHIRIAIPSH